MLTDFIYTKEKKTVLTVHLSALVAGLLLPFSFAPYDQFWVMFPLLSWLFLICADQVPAIAFKRAWLFGFGWFVHGVSWIYYSLHVHGAAPAVLAYLIVALLAMVLALFPGLAFYFARRLFSVSVSRQLLIIFPLVFTLGEWFRGYALTGLPWVQTGYSQIDSWLVGYAPLAGGLGVSAIIAFVCGFLTLMFFKQEGKYSPFVIAPAGLLVIWGTGFALTQINWTEPTGEKIKVSLIQGNIPQKDKWRPNMHHPTLNMYRELTQKNWDSDLIIWPETAVPDFAHRVKPYLADIAKQAKQNNTDVLLGIFISDPVTGRYYNSVMSLQGGVYKKRHLVPLGEYYPFRGLLGFLSQWINIPMSDVDSGSEQQPVLMAAGQKLGVSICFEDAFDRDVLRDLPDASILVNVSNDAWFETSIEAAQHHQIARMRAVETGRFMLRATNTGLTSIIGPKGEVLAIAPQFERAVLTRDVMAYRGATPYVLWQNYFLISLSLLVLFIYWLRLTKNNRQQ